jgi:hypothetical protein
MIENIDSMKQSFAEEFLMERAVKKMELLLEVIDERWPTS